MTVEQNLKTLIGEYTFQICILQDQLEQANAKLAEANNKIAELEKKETDEE